jgi:FkbM family methyltransferase
MTSPSVQQYFALNDLDRKLERYLDKENGVFFEAGANDGMNQSNTLYFERNRGWRGVLVEPIPAQYALCSDRRGAVSKCVWAALVPPNWPRPFVELTYCDLMTVTRSELAQVNQEAHVNDGTRFLKPEERPYNFFAPARTISSILEEARIWQIDLCSLDLEGFECAALMGFDLTRFDVEYFCIECRNLDATKGALGETYEVIDQLSGHDYLFRKRRDVRPFAGIADSGSAA